MSEVMQEILDARSEYQMDTGKDPVYVVLGPTRHLKLKAEIRKLALHPEVSAEMIGPIVTRIYGLVVVHVAREICLCGE